MEITKLVEYAYAAWLCLLRDEKRAGHALVTLCVADLDRAVADIAARGIAGGPVEIIGDAGRKATFTDAEGNAVSFIEVTSARSRLIRRRSSASSVRATCGARGRSPDEYPVTAWLVVTSALLIGAATVSGAWLARRHAARRELCFGAAAGALLVIAGLHLLPDAWSAARQTAIPALAVPMAAIAALLRDFIERKRRPRPGPKRAL